MCIRDRFWIASMTKSINATAVMVLVDEGKLSLDEPASKWLPELAKVKLADGSAPEKPITLRMLLSHTAGIAFPRRAPSDGAISVSYTHLDVYKRQILCPVRPTSATSDLFGHSIRALASPMHKGDAR